MSQPSLVIFDCDGVLIDSEILACQSMIENLGREYGITLTAEEILDNYLGQSGPTTNAQLEARYGVTITQEIVLKGRAITTRLFDEELQPIEGAAHLLQTLAIKKCVASSSSPERLKHSLGLTKLWDYFAPHIFSASQVKNGKPAPDLFLFAAAQMQTPPEECLVIEDSVAGIRAAKVAGMCVYGFTGGSHCRPGHSEKLTQAGAQKIVTTMDELACLLPVPAKEAAYV